MIKRLRYQEIEVAECHVTLWQGIEDRVRAVKGNWLRPDFWWRLLRAYFQLVWRYMQIEDYDIMVVGYPGHFDVFVARLLTWLKGKPLVWDVLMSINLISLERQLNQYSWISKATVNIIQFLEKLACQLPDMLLIDTPQYVRWFEETYGIDPQRFRLVPLGADELLFNSDNNDSFSPPDSDDIFYAVYYGSFVPSHGTRYIVEAARLLADDDTIQFELIGKGGEREKIKELARRYTLTNVNFPGFVNDTELIRRLEQADICLASFGHTPHSLITVHNKVFEVLALARPMIIGYSPAVSQHFKHAEHIYYCKREDARALAGAIRTLKKNPALRDRMAKKGHRYFKAHFSIGELALKLEQHLRELVPVATKTL
jgi:glycosyltransferase involved in cell wall biosynthesis